jgi:hypothetical protein
MNISRLPQRVGEILNQNRFFWRYCTNLGATRAWRRSRAALSAEQERVVDDLKRNGIAKTSVEALLADRAIWEELSRAVEAEEGRCAEKIAEARRDPNRPGHKSYLIELLGPTPVLDPSNVFVRFALLPETLRIATAYFGMHVRLWQFNVWHNVPMATEPRNSQLWHKDPGDRQILRLFLYMDEVGPGSGPLSYVPGSHELGERQVRPEAFLEENTYRTTDAMMEKVAPRETWVTATGPRGTIYFVDTRGYHKGGHVKEKDRLAYNAMWTSAANKRGEYFKRSVDIGPQADPAVAYALGVGMEGGKARENRSAAKY